MWFVYDELWNAVFSFLIMTVLHYFMMIRYDGTLSCDTVIYSDFILCVDSLSHVLSTPCLSYKATKRGFVWDRVN